MSFFVAMVALIVGFISGSYSSDPFLISLDSTQKSVSVDLKKLSTLGGNEDDGKAVNIGQLYLGILHTSMKCVEILDQDPIQYMRQDGLYNRVSVEYDITDDQFNTLVNDNPLVVVKIVQNHLMYRINMFQICGETLLSTSSDEMVQVIAREQLLEQSSVNPHLNRFGLLANSRVNDVPEGVKFIPSNPKRPLLGFGNDPSIQAMMMEPPKCNKDTLRQTLKTAFQLEWFKLPLYATSFYTLKPTMGNKRIREIMYTVFLQQIVRFGQVGNLLMAAGGQLSIVNDTSTLEYPSTGLPGNIIKGMYMPLSKFSLEQISSFLKIHQGQNFSKVTQINSLFTIDAFYDEVQSCIENIGKEIFNQPSQQQITYEIYSPGGKINPVKSLSNALEAMQLIETIDGTEQFEQILEEETSFDEDSGRVYNMIDNPSKSTIFPGTECYDAAKTFNQAVALIIEKLDYAFKGVGTWTMEDAINQMKITGRMAVDMFNVPYKNGAQKVTCGLVWDMDFQ